MAVHSLSALFIPLLGLLCLVPIEATTTLYVDFNQGTAGAACTAVAPCRSLSDALLRDTSASSLEIYLSGDTINSPTDENCKIAFPVPTFVMRANPLNEPIVRCSGYSFGWQFKEGGSIAGVMFRDSQYMIKYQGYLAVTNSTFVSFGGPALLGLPASELTVESTSFTETVVPLGRAAIDCNPCGSVTIRNSNFENLNGTDAGALSATSTTVSISGSNFDGCAGPRAGVIFTDMLSKQMVVESSTFSNWHSPAYWGLYIKSSTYHPDSELEIVGSSFSGDPALLSEGPATVTIQQSTFNILDSDNSRAEGMGVAIEFADHFTLSEDIFTTDSNLHVGVIAIVQSVGSIYKCDIQRNPSNPSIWGISSEISLLDVNTLSGMELGWTMVENFGTLNIERPATIGMYHSNITNYGTLNTGIAGTGETVFQYGDPSGSFVTHPFAYSEVINHGLLQLMGGTVFNSSAVSLVLGSDGTLEINVLDKVIINNISGPLAGSLKVMATEPGLITTGEYEIISTVQPITGNFDNFIGVADRIAMDAHAIIVHVNESGGCPAGGFGTGCSCLTPPPVWGAICHDRDWIIEDSFSATGPLMLIGGNLIIQGDFALNGNTIRVHVTPTSFPSLIVSGTADISGTIDATIKSPLPLGVYELVLVNSSSLNGAFGLDVHEGYNATLCEEIDGVANVSSSSLTIHIHVGDTCDGQSPFLYIAVGSVIGAIVLIVAVVVVAMVIYKKKKESTPRGMVRLEDEKPTHQ